MTCPQTNTQISIFIKFCIKSSSTPLILQCAVLQINQFCEFLGKMNPIQHPIEPAAVPVGCNFKTSSFIIISIKQGGHILFYILTPSSFLSPISLSLRSYHMNITYILILLRFQCNLQGLGLKGLFYPIICLIKATQG